MNELQTNDRNFDLSLSLLCVSMVMLLVSSIHVFVLIQNHVNIFWHTILFCWSIIQIIGIVCCLLINILLFTWNMLIIHFTKIWGILLWGRGERYLQTPLNHLMTEAEVPEGHVSLLVQRLTRSSCSAL